MHFERDVSLHPVASSPWVDAVGIWTWLYRNTCVWQRDHASGRDGSTAQVKLTTEWSSAEGQDESTLTRNQRPSSGPEVTYRAPFDALMVSLEWTAECDVEPASRTFGSFPHSSTYAAFR